ncbi:helix-turn-helix domain-containing protein [Microbacterium testaceum]|uniref:helix-turn-helix domain-containing protein n=1 Tax=Microbacterium testaceum TaxID=2033 RepID=UPI002AC3A13E|nr:helix-turn-helix domain-containing protein [Microbacterium testaceum]MDZ5146324.1 hypothetical protein [Microbacterium testaceum]
MPRLVAAPSDMPEGAVRVQRVIAATPRIEVLRYLLNHPNSTIVDIVEGCGLARETVRAAIADLEETYVTGSIEAGQRRGRPVSFSVDRSTLAKDLGALQAYLLG